MKLSQPLKRIMWMQLQTCGRMQEFKSAMTEEGNTNLQIQLNSMYHKFQVLECNIFGKTRNNPYSFLINNKMFII